MSAPCPWRRRHGIIRRVERPEDTIEHALAEPADSQERRRFVTALHGRGDEATFRAVAALLDSPDVERRSLGADILAQLGAAKDAPVENRPLAAPAVELLIERIDREQDPAVLAAMATAFGHLKDPRCVPSLHRLRSHPDEEVRHAVAFGLLGLDDDLAVETLVELSRDLDADVRDSATFGLGTQLDRDDAEVREALVARLDDVDDDTRAEALRGLAARGDERAIPRLLTELDGPMSFQDPGAIEDALLALAATNPDKRLCRHVQARKRRWESEWPDDPMPDDLRLAVEACGGRGRRIARLLGDG
jgi:HEAT repeat protein